VAEIIIGTPGFHYTSSNYFLDPEVSAHANQHGGSINLWQMTITFAGQQPATSPAAWACAWAHALNGDNGGQLWNGACEALNAAATVADGGVLHQSTVGWRAQGQTSAPGRARATFDNLGFKIDLPKILTDLGLEDEPGILTTYIAANESATAPDSNQVVQWRRVDDDNYFGPSLTNTAAWIYGGGMGGTIAIDSYDGGIGSWVRFPLHTDKPTIFHCLTAEQATGTAPAATPANDLIRQNRGDQKLALRLVYTTADAEDGRSGIRIAARNHDGVFSGGRRVYPRPRSHRLAGNQP
jgi:hypothetical protein